MLTKKRIEELKKLYIRRNAAMSTTGTSVDQIQADLELLRIFAIPVGAGGRCEFEELLALAEKQLKDQSSKGTIPTNQFSCVTCSGAITFFPGGARCVKCGVVTDIRAEAPKR